MEKLISESLRDLMNDAELNKVEQIGLLEAIKFDLLNELKIEDAE